MVARWAAPAEWAMMRKLFVSELETAEGFWMSQWRASRMS